MLLFHFSSPELFFHKGKRIDRKKDKKDKSLQLYREEALKKWKLKGNHSYFSAIIISDKTNDKHEKITLTIRLPMQVITKHYKL